MGIRTRYIVAAFVNLFTMPVKKMFSYNNFHFCLPELVSPRAKIQIDNGGNMILGRKCNIKAGTFIAVLPRGNLVIGENVFINRDCKIVVRDTICINDGVNIGPNCLLYDHDHDKHNIGGYISKPITIGKNTWIGANVIILKGVTIGDNCTIAAGSVVNKDVPSNSIMYQRRDTVIKPIQ